MRPRALAAALVLVGGVLYGAAFPPHDASVCAWLALVPLLAVAARASARGAFLAGALYGAVFFAMTVPWVVRAVAAYFGTGTLPALALSAAICLLYVSGYVGLFAVAARRLLATGPWRALVAIPALWVTCELARATLLTGLPWELLGHSQWRGLALIQVADLGGVYALSFLVAAGNVGAYLALRALVRPGRRIAALDAVTPLAAVVLLVASAALYGEWRRAGEAARPDGPASVVALVQGNLPLAQSWRRVRAERNLVAYAGLSRRVIAEARPDLLVWPEYALSAYPESVPLLLPMLEGLARATTAGLVFGAPRIEAGRPGRRYFNSAYHLAPDGARSAYDKIRLVPFAEYRPVPWGEAIAAEAGREFGAGSQSTVFTTAIGRLGVLICYEVIFPDLARASVRAGAEVLLNLSNDGWLDSAGLGAGAQHLSIAVFRAVETRRYLARAASSGISGFVDPLGRPFALIEAGERGARAAEVRARRDLTFYVRYGDVFAGACVLVGLASLGATAVGRRGA